MLSSLPTEILDSIILHLEKVDVEAIACTSKRLREVALIRRRVLSGKVSDVKWELERIGGLVRHLVIDTDGDLDLSDTRISSIKWKGDGNVNLPPTLKNATMKIGVYMNSVPKDHYFDYFRLYNFEEKPVFFNFHNPVGILDVSQANYIIIKDRVRRFIAGGVNSFPCMFLTEEVVYASEKNVSTCWGVSRIYVENASNVLIAGGNNIVAIEKGDVGFLKLPTILILGRQAKLVDPSLNDIASTILYVDDVYGEYHAQCELHNW